MLYFYHGQKMKIVTNKTIFFDRMMKKKAPNYFAFELESLPLQKHPSNAETVVNQSYNIAFTIYC